MRSSVHRRSRSLWLGRRRRGFAAVAAPPPADAPCGRCAHGNGNWKTIQSYCFECHNTDDWAGGVAFDSMSADGIPQDAKIWEQAVRKLRGGMMPPPGHKRPDNAAIKNLVSYLETTLDDASTHPDPGRVPLRRLNRREYANAVHDLIGLDVDGAAWLPQDPLKDGFDTNAQLLQVTPNFLDQSVAAARALALQAVGDPKAAPIDTTYGNIANMIISLNPRPGMGTGNQEKYQDGMPFGTRGGMVAEHWFAADGEYSLTIGDMAMAREVPKLEFENTVLVLLDGKEILASRSAARRTTRTSTRIWMPASITSTAACAISASMPPPASTRWPSPSCGAATRKAMSACGPIRWMAASSG